MRTMMRLLMFGLLLLGVGCWRSRPAGTDEKDTRVAPDLPEDLVEEWKKAGARKTGMGASRGSARLFDKVGPEEIRRKPDNHRYIEQVVPAFMLTWKERAIAKLPKPGSPFGLSLHDWQVTPESMKELAALDQLTMLELEPAEGTGGGLEHLAGLKNLTMLGMKGEHITNALLEGLSSLKDLTHLDLEPVRYPYWVIDRHPIARGAWKDGFTDEGLRHLAGLKKLTSLNLSNTKVTDKGMKHLAGLKDLTRLDLGHTKVGDEGIKHLAGLKNLDYLHLAATAITDEGLEHLAGLENLTHLNLNATKVTSGGAGKLYDRMMNLDSLSTTKMSWKRRGPFKEVKSGG